MAFTPRRPASIIMKSHLVIEYDKGIIDSELEKYVFIIWSQLRNTSQNTNLTVAFLRVMMDFKCAKTSFLALKL